MTRVRHRDDGFSLVEILVALFIMALASAMIVMAIPARKDPLELEASRFEALLSRALDQAISRGQARGIRVEENTYRVYARVGGRWVPVQGEAETLPGEMSLILLEQRGEADDPRPQIIADAAGIVSGASVRISAGQESRDIDLMAVVGQGGDD